MVQIAQVSFDLKHRACYCPPDMRIDPEQLERLGWQPYFMQQLSSDEFDTSRVARVIEQHKKDVLVDCVDERLTLPLLNSMPKLVVGDWVVVDSKDRVSRLLDRKSCFKRKAAGPRVAEQIIASNVDTAFIVCSLNDDYSLNRIERYLSLANEAGAEPVVVLSKMDLCDDPDHFRQEVQDLDPLLAVDTVNCLDEGAAATLSEWTAPGQTIVMLGSSGSGKSTLTNTLLGEELQETGAIREDDSKGRHTTTRRSLLTTPGGCLIIDTPGMRELQLSDCETGVATTFADIEAIAANCKFNDCKHENEPGCAVRAALESGELDPRRFNNYQKLKREQAHNAASIAQKRASSKALGKFYKRTMMESHKIKRGEDV